MKLLFKHLRLPFELDLEPLATFECAPNKVGHIARDLKDVDARLLQLLSDVDIHVSHLEAFFTPPKWKMAIHVDSSTQCDMAKLNFTYGADGSFMNWWALKDKNFSVRTKLTEIGTEYLHFPPEACKLIGSAKIGKPTLVNAGTPHSILNPTNESRWTLSFVLDDVRTKEHLSITEAFERLAAYKA